MNNIARAALVINETYADEWVKSHMTPLKVAQALADDGQLMPDLPEPTRWKQNEEPKWDACDTTVAPAGYEGRVIVEDFDYQWEASAGDIRALAYAMLAAANYAERSQA